MTLVFALTISASQAGQGTNVTVSQPYEYVWTVFVSCLCIKYSIALDLILNDILTNREANSLHYHVQRLQKFILCEILYPRLERNLHETACKQM